MNLESDLTEIRKIIQEHKDTLKSEEATKSALVMPFLRALGYDVTNPNHVTPELIADVGMKKGEKVDYGLGPRGSEAIIVECKRCDVHLSSANLEKYKSQIYRYFVTKPSVKFAVITNGIEYVFYSDIDNVHVMDNEPFYRVNLSFIPSSKDIEILNMFGRENFDLEILIEKSGDLLKRSRVKSVILQQTSTPNDEFCDYVAAKIHNGRYTSKISEYYRPLVREVVSEIMDDRIQAIREDVVRENNQKDDDVKQVVIDGYNIIRAISSFYVDPDRICIRENQSYCAILLDDNSRKTIARLHFNNPAKLNFGFITDKEETKVQIDSVRSIFHYHENIMARISELEPPFG